MLNLEADTASLKITTQELVDWRGAQGVISESYLLPPRWLELATQPSKSVKLLHD